MKFYSIFRFLKPLLLKLVRKGERHTLCFEEGFFLFFHNSYLRLSTNKQLTMN